VISPDVLKSLGRRMRRSRHSEGSVMKVGKRRKNWLGYWFVYVTVDGKELRRKRRKVLGPATMPKHEARDLLRAVIARSEGAPGPFSADCTVAQLWQRYAEFKSGAWSKATSDVLASLFKKAILPSLGTLPVAGLTIDPLQAVLNAMARDGRSLSSLQKARVHLKAMFEYASDVDLIDRNPARGKKLAIPHRGVKKPCERFLELSEVHALLEAAEGRERLILRLFLVCGFRPAELFALRVDDVEAGQIRVDEAIKQAEKGADRLGDPKTDGSKAYVATSRALDTEVAAWLKGLPDAMPGAWLFPSERGTPIRPENHLKRVLQPLAEMVGIKDLTYQALRRTCATYFRQDIQSARAQLRHATAATTAKHYLKSVSSDHRAAVEALDSEFCESGVGK